MSLLKIFMIFIGTMLFISCSDDCEFISIKTSALPEGKVAEVYYFKLVLDASCDLTNRSVTLTKGSLPKGMRLEASGEFMGTPEESGEFEITVDAQVCFGTSGYQFTDCHSKTKDFVLTIKE